MFRFAAAPAQVPTAETTLDDQIREAMGAILPALIDAICNDVTQDSFKVRFDLTGKWANPGLKTCNQPAAQELVAHLERMLGSPARWNAKTGFHVGGCVQRDGGPRLSFTFWCTDPPWQVFNSQPGLEVSYSR